MSDPATLAYETLIGSYEDGLERARLAKERLVARSKAALLRALEPALNAPIESIRELCSEQAKKTCAEILEFAERFPGSVAEDMRFERVDVQADWDQSSSGLVKGDASVLMRGCHYSRGFSAEPGEAAQAAAKAAIACMVSANVWFCDGLERDLDPESSCEEGSEHVAFLNRAHEIGESGVWFVERVDLETRWSGPRWTAQMRLEEMIKACAAEGLLPSDFERASVRLYGGYPGEPTMVSSFEIKTLGGFSSHATNAMSSLKETSPEESGRQWDLPSLSDGEDALWEAFSQKLALAQALGWPSVPLAKGAQKSLSECRVAAERALIEQSAGVALADKKRAGL